VAVFLVILGTCACAVPLAPGYRIMKESREVKFVLGTTPEVQFTGRYTFENSGTTDLEFIDIGFPEQKAYGRNNLRIEVDGQVEKLTSLREESSVQDIFRMPFDHPWIRGEMHRLVVKYSFTSPEDSGERIAVGEDNFHLGPRGWSPQWLPPKHFLSPYPSPPPRIDYTVHVPADFRVLGGGKKKGRKQSGGEADYGFELRPGDLPPFIIAGRYVVTASESESKSDTAIFWTRQPLKENPQAAMQRIDSAWNVLVKDFGPLGKNVPAPHIVEATELRGHVAGDPGPSAAGFPGGVLVNAELLAFGIGSDRFLEPVTHALAHNWFGNQVFFSRYSALGLGEGLPEYATLVVEESQNGQSRRQGRIREYLREYDDARKNTEESPLGVTSLSDPPGQRRIALAKAALFFTALEDSCGEGPMRDGLRSMVRLLRGQEATYGTLRSALEQASNKNLAEPFRVWLNEKDVPASFRSRYQGETNSTRASSP
jgi:Peptidase family M1 domain